MKRHHINHALVGAALVLITYLIPFLSIAHGMGWTTGWYAMKEILQYRDKKHNRSHILGHIEDWLWAVFGAISMATLLVILF